MNHRLRLAATLLLFLSSTVLFSQQHTSSIPSSAAHAALPALTHEQTGKIGSGLLLMHAREKTRHAPAQLMHAETPMLTTAIYMAHEPAAAEVAELEKLGVRSYPASWIPPVANHPLGFFIAKVPVEKIGDVLSLASVKKMDTAESTSAPVNNVAAIAVKANAAWTAGWTGSGVKVAVLDAGLDYTLPATEIPGDLQYSNYSDYPTSIDLLVSNPASGHGTHVTGTVLGKGGYSTSPVLNTGNGGGAYKGMAPDAKLVFLRIGNSTNAGATSAAEVGALKAAVDTYNAKVINLSYGGWDAYHDGSNSTAQATDYAFSNGAVCIMAAGNEANKARHYSGTVAANSMTDDIRVNVTNAVAGQTKLEFNLMWVDGAEHKNLELRFYDASVTNLTDVTYYGTTESPRGTESAYATYNPYVPSGSSVYYLRVVNPSSSPQFFHIYENWGGSKVTFASPDPNFTITSPAHADHALAVGAFVSRTGWTDNTDHGWGWGYTADTLAPFSGLGPRVDGVQKPDITAPGSVVISIRDRYASAASWEIVDNDGAAGGDANYRVMHGTSMASPVVAGCAALLLQHTPGATPQQVYDAIQQTGLVDSYTGAVPNMTWGYGKLDVNAALASPALPVELASFTSSVMKGAILLSWRTATETNNYGFEIERKTAVPAPSWSKIGFVPGAGTSNAPHEYAYTDKFAPSGVNTYRLKQIDRDGTVAYSREVEAAIEGAPLEYALAQNYPNPFNPSTTMQFSIARKGHVRLTVYDLLGRVHSVLVDREMDAGAYAAEWNASHASSGVYLCRLESGGFSAVKKLVVQK